MAQPGSRHIAADSPEARGRSERTFGTVCRRSCGWPSITTIAAANCWLAETCLPAHNAASALAQAEARSAFVPDHRSQAREIMCIPEERPIGNDDTVNWRGLSLQIPTSPLRPHFVCATARSYGYPDGRLAIFHGPHRLPTPIGKGTCDDAKRAA